MNPGYHPDYGLPITAPRGGIRYPTPKETDMPENDYTDEQMLAEAMDYRRRLDEQIKKLQQRVMTSRYPKVPAAKDGNMFGINIKFTPGGTVYRFLILRTPAKGWYTTGQAPETKHFEDWTALVDWLRGPDVYWHGEMYQLIESGLSVMQAEGRVK
jgi:hypothetical protein